MEEVAPKLQKEDVIKEIKSDIDELSAKIDTISNNLDNSTSSTHQNAANLNQTNEELENIQEALNRLSDKFDVWQNNVEPMIANAHTAMQYDNYLITVLALVVAVFTFVFQKWASKSKDEAVEEAIGAIEETIARGILPRGSNIKKKLTETILSSHQFVEAVKRANEYIELSEEADEERTANFEGTDKNINLDDVKKAKEAEENGRKETKTKKSGIINKMIKKPQKTEERKK